MKTKNTLVTIVALTTLFSGSVTAQTDTVKVIKETKETVVIRDTVVKEKPQTEKSGLKRAELGMRYMPTFASMSLRTSNGDVIKGELTLSHGYGIIMGFNISKNIGTQGEVNYLEITQKYKDQNLNRQVKVSYLSIPVLLSLNTNKTSMVNVNFVAGPQFGINLGSSIETSGTGNAETIHAVVGASGTDVGLAYGTGLEIALNKLYTFRIDLGYRGFYGLVDGSSTQSSSNPDTFNVIVRASRQTHAAYLGVTWCF